MRILLLALAAALLLVHVGQAEARSKMYFIDHLTEMRECIYVDPHCLDDAPPDIRHMILTLPVLYAINVWSIAAVSTMIFIAILYVTGVYFKKRGEPGLLSPAFFEQTVKADDVAMSDDGRINEEVVLEEQKDRTADRMGGCRP